MIVQAFKPQLAHVREGGWGTGQLPALFFSGVPHTTPEEQLGSCILDGRGGGRGPRLCPARVLIQAGERGTDLSALTQGS